MSEDGREENKKLGGFKTMPLILGNEICDRFASTGFNANLITYLTQIMHMPMVEASNVLTNFSGTSSLTPIIGALIADSFAGRFWSITVGLIIYLIGMISLTISAVAPSLPHHLVQSINNAKRQHQGSFSFCILHCF
ncbi:Protein NRT1/ PTR FAMILY 3.1 [Rhynchospora pubera]|uniref:Protein NRT1/ PTR FAMILY 3.1 n=1 Tax=Rhynchospora pubera TaxID=906938 RepID=A0AAV8GD96_9POAL|nr:Protein NRT1/ PTR FAMILY 3.1 [Rhynchospora pubera]